MAEVEIVENLPAPVGLTEELAEIWESIPAHEREKLLAMPADMRNTFIRVFRTRQTRIEDDAVEVAAEIREQVAPGGKLPAEQGTFAFCQFPTDWSRTSPFFPISRNQLGQREQIHEMVITRTAWGEITYTGPRLSIQEEDVLMAVLALLDDARCRQPETFEGKSTYAYRGPVLPILRLLGYNSPGAADYARVLNALDLMVGAKVKMITHKKNSRGQRKPKTTMVTTILTAARMDHETKHLVAVVNPFFFESFVAGTVTLIDVITRSKLGTIAKCLHRFILSHRDDRWDGHYMTLSAALNLDLTQQAKYLRRYLKNAIAELVEQGILMTASKIDGDIVNLVRVARTGLVKKK